MVGKEVEKMVAMVVVRAAMNALKEAARPTSSPSSPRLACTLSGEDGSNYFGEPNYIVGHINMNGRDGFLSSSSSTLSSSRKGKKKGSDKPKQPQRGLGVAQLEKIRTHSQLGSCAYLPSRHGLNNPYEAHMRLDTPHSSSSPSYNGFYGHMMGLPDLNKENATYGDSQSSNISRWDQGNSGFGSTQHYVEPSMITRSFFDQGSLTNNNKSELMDLMGSSTHNSESQDIDLELRL